MASSSSKGKRHLGPPKKAKLDDVRNEMNVTPLVDVCLVLLIIFMVIGPMLARGKEVPLPATENHSEVKDNREPIVAVDQYGKLFVDKDPVASIDEMVERVQREWKVLAATNARTGSPDTSGESRVLLKVAREVTYGQVYPVIIAIHEMGAVGIDLGTEEAREDK